MKRLYVTFSFIVLTSTIFPQNNSSFFSDLQNEINSAGDKIIALVEVTPEDKFTWRPAEGVRSVSEVFMHIAIGNHFLFSIAGIKFPDGINRDMEKTVTNKEEIINHLKNSFNKVEENLATISESDLEKEVNFFGNKMTLRQLLFIIMNHNHEHLGQSIAYARINNITPPWSN